MKKHRALWLTAFLYALAAAPIMVATTMSSVGADPAASALDLTTAIPARSPHPSLGDQAKVFGRFVGTWEVEYKDILKDGKRLHRTGLFIVGWVMDGRAIQDLWIVDPSAGHAEREVYSDVRYFDPKTGTWPSIFIDPQHASMAKFSGGAVAEDRIVLQTSDLGSKQTRWSFEDIGPDTFVFRDQASSDDGKTWALQAEYHMKRRSPAALP